MHTYPYHNKICVYECQKYIYHNWTSCGLRLTHKVWCVVKKGGGYTIELYTLEMTHILLYAINSFFSPFIIAQKSALQTFHILLLLLLQLSHSVFCASKKISKK